MTKKELMTLGIQYIVFDMDGTLTATAQATEIAIKAISKKHDLPPITAADIRGAMGLGGLEFHAKLFPTVAAERLPAIGADIDQLEEENVIRIGKDILFPGVYDMLARLAAEKYPIFIASTGSARHVDSTLRATGIKHFFTAIECDEPQKRDMVNRLMRGGNPTEWMMVGDMFKDAEAARANHIFALGAGFGYLHADNAPLFDAVIQTPADIFTFLAKK